MFGKLCWCNVTVASTITWFNMLPVFPWIQARQTRPNSGGVAEGHPRFDKGGVAIIFYFLRVKNRTFRVFTLSD